jgi:hypothetical protein
MLAEDIHEFQVPEIREKARTTEYKVSAREYCVSPKTIANISLGYRWVSIPPLSGAAS